MEPPLYQQVHRPPSYTSFPLEALRHPSPLTFRWPLACQPRSCPVPTSPWCTFHLSVLHLMSDGRCEPCVCPWLQERQGWPISDFCHEECPSFQPCHGCIDIVAQTLLLIFKRKIYVTEIQSIEHFFKGKAFHNFVRMHPNLPTGKNLATVHWMSGLKWKKSHM